MKARISARRLQVLRRIVGGALIGGLLVTIVVFWKAGRRSATPPDLTEALPENAEQQLSGFSFTRSEGGRVVFSIHSTRTVAFGDDSATVLEEVVAEIFGRQGDRRDVIRTARCEYDTVSGDFFIPGAVEIELDHSGAPDGDSQETRLKVETSQLRFHQDSATASSRQAVTFRYGPLAGQGKGLRYAAQEELVEVESDVRLILDPPAGSGKPPLQFTASRLELDKDAGLIRLYPPVLGRRGNQRLVAEQAILYLDERGHIRQVVLEGGVEAGEETATRTLTLLSERATAWFDPESRELTSLEANQGSEVRLEEAGRSTFLKAREIKALFSADDFQVREIVATGDAQLRSEILPDTGLEGDGRETKAGVKPPRGEVFLLRGPELRFTLRPGGGSLERLVTEENARLEMTRADGAGERKRITADRFVAHFDEQSRLERFEAYPRARLEVEPGPSTASSGAVAKRSESDRLTGFFNSSDGTLVRLEQVGHFRYFEGERRARAERADYSALRQEFVLQGEPVLWDSNSRITARKITLDERTEKVEARGEVRGTHFYNDPSKLSSNRDPYDSIPTNVIADSAVLWGRTQKVRYEGGVRAWRGQDVITAAVLEVFRRERRVEAEGKVSTSYVQRLSGTGSGGRPLPVTISSDSLKYSGEEGQATYLGNVALRTAQTSIQAARMDVLFSRKGEGEVAQVEQATGEGQVVMIQPGRRAEGERMTYLPETGEIILEGGPPVAYDQQRGSTTGQRLTFSLTGDSIGVHGGENSPTITRHRRVR